MWDEALPGVELARLKYISFMKSVRSSEDCKELQEYVKTNMKEAVMGEFTNRKRGREVNMEVITLLMVL